MILRAIISFSIKKTQYEIMLFDFFICSNLLNVGILGTNEDGFLDSTRSKKLYFIIVVIIYLHSIVCLLFRHSVWIKPIGKGSQYPKVL